MTYAELQQKMVLISHRKDMNVLVLGFISDAQQRVNQRLGLDLPPLVNDSDTDEILTNNYLLYFYPAMKALYEYIIELETASYYESLYQQEADGYYVTRTGTTPLTITPEVPAP